MKGYSNLLFDHWSLFLWKNKLRKKKKDNVFVILWASLVAQRLKCLPLMQETWVQSLGWADLLEKEMATHSSIPGKSQEQKSLRATVHGATKS